VATDYFNEIEAHFALRRGTPFILSAKDWVLMKKWRDDGVPLPVVIEAIDTVFEKNETSGRRKVISSLSYCRHAVKEIWEDRKSLYVGSDETTPEAAAAAILETLAQQLEGSVLGAPFAPRVRQLAAEKSVPKIEERLMELESELLDAAVAASEVDAMREEIKAAMGNTSRIDEKTIARTVEANLRRLVRERFGLPRLTLFT
jgi:signal recognition particle GTPase